jgi:ornithine lipid ester-linked acyl 2-hydroxylase
MLHAFAERMISRLSRDGNRTFFEADAFPWVARVESDWRLVRTELDALLTNREAIPNFQDLSEEQRALTAGEEWKTFVFYAYGHAAGENCARCPQTARLLRSIPGLKSAMFSILAPGKHLPEHRGPYKGVLRYHLGLIIPEPPGSCRIRVGNEVRTWSEGRSLIFDDSHPHEVWNDSARHRVVLFVDIERPLPFPLSVVNRFMIRRMAAAPWVMELIARVREGAGAAERRGAGVKL